MGKSTNGPSFQDCLTYAQDIRSNTGYELTVLLTPELQSAGEYCFIDILGVKPAGEWLEPRRSVSVSLLYPSVTWATLEAALFAGLGRIDGEIARATFQEVVDIT